VALKVEASASAADALLAVIVNVMTREPPSCIVAEAVKASEDDWLSLLRVNLGVSLELELLLLVEEDVEEEEVLDALRAVDQGVNRAGKRGSVGLQHAIATASSGTPPSLLDSASARACDSTSPQVAAE